MRRPATRTGTPCTARKPSPISGEEMTAARPPVTVRAASRMVTAATAPVAANPPRGDPPGDREVDRGEIRAGEAADDHAGAREDLGAGEKALHRPIVSFGAHPVDRPGIERTARQRRADPSISSATTQSREVVGHGVEAERHRTQRRSEEEGSLATDEVGCCAGRHLEREHHDQISREDEVHLERIQAAAVQEQRINGRDEPRPRDCRARRRDSMCARFGSWGTGKRNPAPAPMQTASAARFSRAGDRQIGESLEALHAATLLEESRRQTDEGQLALRIDPEDRRAGAEAAERARRRREAELAREWTLAAQEEAQADARPGNRPSRTLLAGVGVEVVRPWSPVWLVVRQVGRSAGDSTRTPSSSPPRRSASAQRKRSAVVETAPPAGDLGARLVASSLNRLQRGPGRRCPGTAVADDDRHLAAPRGRTGGRAPCRCIPSGFEDVRGEDVAERPPAAVEAPHDLGEHRVSRHGAVVHASCRAGPRAPAGRPRPRRPSRSPSCSDGQRRQAGRDMPPVCDSICAIGHALLSLHAELRHAPRRPAW